MKKQCSLILLVLLLAQVAVFAQTSKNPAVIKAEALTQVANGVFKINEGWEVKSQEGNTMQVARDGIVVQMSCTCGDDGKCDIIIRDGEAKCEEGGCCKPKLTVPNISDGSSSTLHDNTPGNQTTTPSTLTPKKKGKN